MKPKRLFVFALFAAVVASYSGSATAAEFMFRARIGGRMVEGKPVYWTKSQMFLLGRDGQLYEFDPRHANEPQKTSPRFFGYSFSEMKTELQKEFGKPFDVSTTRHYLVVHPKGERDRWANRFEDLYKRFEHYFRVRGFKLEEPPYPLVAVVFRNEDEFRRHAEDSGMPVPPSWLGYYAHNSNRTFLYNTATSDSADWSKNASTIIHEATHQTAYNTGIHRRFTGTPKWVSEGLATMFEAPGVWNAQYDRTQADRINQGWLHAFKDFATRWKPGGVLNQVASDRLFQSNETDAYALSWALSFYLCETQPRLYGEYLAKTAEREMLTDYTAEERVADFQDVFGNEAKMFEIKFLRYMDEIE
jgi:hypothetical protein